MTVANALGGGVVDVLDELVVAVQLSLSLDEILWKSGNLYASLQHLGVSCWLLVGRYLAYS